MSALYWTITFCVLTFGIQSNGKSTENPNALSPNTQMNKSCNVTPSWTCGNGDCIDIEKRCNGAVECADGSDETVTECISVQCPKDKFRCAYGACVDPSAECNGQKDCADDSDELTENCLPSFDAILRGNCSVDEFHCRSGECIPLDNICDGRVECSDRSDESLKYCASKYCPSFGFRCGYGGCIDIKFRCDGHFDCADRSDENYLLCGRPKGGVMTTKAPPRKAQTKDDAITTWTCDNGESIGIKKLCDGQVDCTDGSDETVTQCISVQCHHGKYQCAYGACVNPSAECNGRKDCADNSDELTEKCLPNLDKMLRGNCSEDSFQCRSGECILLDKICEGRIECADRSDESVETCASHCCPLYGFRCGYGGCIDFGLRCDGNFDCADHSDENDLLCNDLKEELPKATTITTESPTIDKNGIPMKPTAPSLCQIGHIPRNGWIEYAAPPNDLLPFGASVPSQTQIAYKCSQNYLLRGSTANICIDGKWRHEVPDCNPHCSAEAISGVSIFPISCRLNDKETSCDEPAVPGTIAQIHCRDQYERVSEVRYQMTTCGNNGTWSPRPTACTPICEDELFAHRSNITHVPWHVTIYKRNGDTADFQCGGTIVNARVIIAAKSCFGDPSDDSSDDLSLFRVIAGKEKHDFDAEENNVTQKFKIERIHGEPGYNDPIGKYAPDMVVVTLKSEIEFNSYIKPICIPHGSGLVYSL